MTTWARAFRDLRCGCCGETVRRGEPVLEIRLKGPRLKNGVTVGVVAVKRVLYRCSKFACAGEAIPENLPAIFERPPVTLPSTLMRFDPELLPLDYKSRSGGN